MGRGKFLLPPPYSCPGLLVVSHDFINLQFGSKLPGEGVMKVQCGNNDQLSQHWLRLTMYQALHKVLHSDFILYFPQAYGGGPGIIPCRQVRKPKLSVVKLRPRDNDARITEVGLQCRQLTLDLGSWLVSSRVSQVSWNQRTPFSLNLCQEVSGISPDSWMYVKFPCCLWFSFILFFLK